MSLQGKHVLVTGAGGFIGSHLTERLVQAGARTRAFVHYRGNGSAGWLDHSSCRDDVEIIAGDICDRDSVAGAVKGADVIFHLAALIGIPYSYHVPVSYLRTNAEGVLNVLQAARANSVEILVHTSTSEVYGTAKSVPITEDHPLQGQSPYSASKIAADKLAESFFLSFGVPVVTVRPFNTFGPRQSARAVIPTIVTQLLSGSVVRLGNVQPTRDFNYVANTVDGFILAAEKKEAIGRTINIGSGTEITIGELARKIAGLLGKELVIETRQERIRPEDSEVDRLLAGNSLAKTILGWKPNVSLEEGLSETVDWIRSHLHEYRTGVYTI